MKKWLFNIWKNFNFTSNPRIQITARYLFSSMRYEKTRVDLDVGYLILSYTAHGNGKWNHLSGG